VALEVGVGAGRGGSEARRQCDGGSRGGADWDRGGCVRGLRGVLGGKGARTAGERQPARLVSEVRGEPACCFEGLEARASGVGENDGARRRGQGFFYQPQPPDFYRSGAVR
jgi:hypothetical protein